jgi:hypothetical protein
MESNNYLLKNEKIKNLTLEEILRNLRSPSKMSKEEISMLVNQGVKMMNANEDREVVRWVV